MRKTAFAKVSTTYRWPPSGPTASPLANATSRANHNEAVAVHRHALGVVELRIGQRPVEEHGGAIRREKSAGWRSDCHLLEFTAVECRLPKRRRCAGAFRRDSTARPPAVKCGLRRGRRP